MNKKILIVDDNSDYLDLLKNLLETFERGIEIIMADNGSLALRTVEEERPDAIILDIQMPGMNGYEICKHIRNNEKIPFIPIILVTGKYLSTENRIAGYQAGCDDYLSKPFNKAELFARLNTVLRIKNLHEELKNERDNLELTVTRRTQELRASQKILMEYKNVVEGSEDMIIALNQQYRFVLVNYAFLKNCRQKRQDVIGHHLSEILGKEAFLQLQPYIDRCFEDTIVEFEFHYCFPESGPKDLNGTYYPLKDRKGTIYEITAIFKDISDRKLAEKEIATKSYELKRRVNELNCLYSIYKLVEKSEISLDHIIPEIVKLIPQSFQFPNNTCARIKIKDKVFTSIPFQQSQQKLSQKIFVNEKCIGYLEVYVTKLDSKTNKSSFSEEENNLIHAITDHVGKFIEKKETDEKLKGAYNIINMSPAVAFLWKNKKNLPVEFVSENVQSLWGYSAKEFILGGIHYLDTIHTDDLERVEKEITHCNDLKEAGKFSHEPYRIITKNGRVKWVDGRTFVKKNDKGKITHFQGVMIDISELKELEEQKQLHQQQLIQADKMASLGILVSGVAHEINNPTNFIKLNIDVMDDIVKEIIPILDEYSNQNDNFILTGIPYKEMRARLIEVPTSVTFGIDRIIKIIQDLKDFARMDSGEMADSININSVIESSIGIVSHLIKKSTKHFSVDYYPDIPLMRGNFHKLEQVFLNLIINSCQSLKSKKDSIHITSHYNQQEDLIIVKVIDEGSGIAPKDLKHILDPFYTTKRDNGGTGLGLSVSYSILREHGGALDFAANNKRGTIVTVTIPVKGPQQDFKQIT